MLHVERTGDSIDDDDTGSKPAVLSLTGRTKRIRHTARILIVCFWNKQVTA